MLNFHKKKFHKFSDSFSNNNEKQEDEQYQEEKSFKKMNKTYKSHKVIPNLEEISTEELVDGPMRRIYIKKKLDNKEEDDTYKENNIYEKKIIKKQIESYYEESDKSSDYYIKKKNSSVKHQSSIGSDKPIYISKRYLPTKLKIYKCVIYKNMDPDVNEDTIKTMLHKKGSQIMEKGGFVMKLPNMQENNISSYKMNSYKSYKNFFK